MNCARCGRVVIGTAWTCLVHGDQRDVGNRAPVQESIRDRRFSQRRDRDAKRESAANGWEHSDG
jgi:hypothetical protein